jgi:hypothetical protein
MEPPKKRKKGKGSGTRIGRGPNHRNYATGIDSCIPLTADRTAGERVVTSMIPEKIRTIKMKL